MDVIAPAIPKLNPPFNYNGLTYHFEAGVSLRGAPMLTLPEARERALSRLSKLFAPWKIVDDTTYAFLGEPIYRVGEEPMGELVIVLVFSNGSTGLLRGKRHWVNRKWTEL